MGFVRIVVVAAAAFVPASAYAGAGPLIVDADDPSCDDGGEGTSAAPLCTLAAAFEHDSLAPGLRIQLRDSATNYQAALTPGSAPDGTADMPIVVEPFPGHLPIVSGNLALNDVSYWHIRGLQFAPEAGTANNAISVRGTEILEGIVIAENTVVGWSSGAAAISLVSANGGGGEDFIVGPRVERNVVLGSAVSGIDLSDTVDAIVERNVVRGLFCEPDGVPDIVGIEVRESVRGRVTRNQVLDFDPVECSERVSGILYVHGDDGRVDHNLVRGIEGGSAARMGILPAGNASDVTVDHNIVERIADCGICPGFTYSNGGQGHRIVANTVVDAGDYAIRVSGAANVAVLDNILVGSTVAAIIESPPDGVPPLSVNHNLYWGTGNIGQCGSTTYPDLETWQGACGGDDSESLVEDPLLPAQFAETDDFTPPSDSPAVDIGVAVDGVVEDFSGRGVDVGALEAPIALGAQIDEVAPKRIRLFIDAKRTGDFVFEGSDCQGFTVSVDGESAMLDECTRVTQLIEIELAEAAVEGQEITLSYSGDHITDVAAIGGLIGARLQPFELVVDNGAPMGEAGTGTGADEGGGDDSVDTADTTAGSVGGSTTQSGPVGTSTTGSFDTDGDDGGADGGIDDSGCGCRSRPGPVGSLWALFALGFVARRRYSAADVSRANHRTL